MKRIFSTLILACVAIMMVAAPKNSKLMPEASSIPGVTTVYLGPAILAMAQESALDDLDDNIRDAIKELKSLEIITTEKKSAIPSLDAMAEKVIDQYTLDLLMEVNSDENEQVYLYAPVSSTPVDDSCMLMITQTPEDYVIMAIRGRIDISAFMKDDQPQAQ
ncbi:MAG: DUF4252 domain-containing protein [Bacteroidales bacterium]|nr:DUF4252 domain-containing protein [Bacteroidales bacterium]